MASGGLDPARLVALLSCGKERGSAFLLSSELAITCRHCIVDHLMDRSPISLRLTEQTIEAELAEPEIPTEYDTVFIRLKTPIAAVPEFQLVASHLPRGLAWESYGFPGVRGGQAMYLSGDIAQSLDGENTARDVELQCTGIDLVSNFKGFSGAPIIIDGSIRGMLQWRLDGGLGAISFARLHRYLEKAGVAFRALNQTEPLPAALADAIAAGIPNWRTMSALEEQLSTSICRYILLTGNPGSGKTLIAASFDPAHSAISVAGRYFAAGHVGSDLPPAHFKLLSTFADWLSNESALRSCAAVAVTPEATTGELALSLRDNLQVIGAASTDGGLNVLVIDGADATSNSSAPGFLPYLPPTLPPGVAIVLTTTNAPAVLAACEHITFDPPVSVQPLPLHDCEWLVAQRLEDGALASDILQIAQLSEGNPLALTYFGLVRRICGCERASWRVISSASCRRAGALIAAPCTPG